MSTEALVILRILDLASVILTATSQLQQASTIMQKARDEGRSISDEEWASLDDQTANALENFSREINGQPTIAL